MRASFIVSDGYRLDLIVVVPVDLAPRSLPLRHKAVLTTSYGLRLVWSRRLFDFVSDLALLRISPRRMNVLWPCVCCLRLPPRTPSSRCSQPGVSPFPSTLNEAKGDDDGDDILVRKKINQD